MSDATISITDAIQNAVKTTALNVQVGDYVFSTTGQPDQVTRVESPATDRRRTTVRLTPRTLWPIVLDPEDTITILRGAQ